MNNQRVARPRRSSAQGNLAEKLEDEGRFKVWGMTARVLVDAVRVAYDEEPEMEHNLDYGDGKIIELANSDGSFQEISEPNRESEGERGKM